ncbi:alpha/beta fold hydrolase [Oceanibium sediminis]|uniref:alpha/beta fold hydrolase n=1 Tax=Oceanibium sediminis TaxID=2026339 RepID=UPI000DD3AA73|nr:alpha/beta hydrolase [Oceanibium sediminis]
MEILAVPGINNTAATFDGLRRHMPAGHSVITTDCPAIDDIDGIAHALLAGAPERFVVLGHSFGGYVALAMLAAAPERIAGVVLVNSNDWADTETVAATRREKAARAEQGEYAELAAAASARAYHPDNAGRADLLAERAAGLENYGPERFAAHMRACAARPDRSELLKAAGRPVLVISGDHDVVIPTERQTQMAQRLGAEQTIIATAGHMLPAEQPEALAKALSEWIDTSLTDEKGH